MAIESRPSFLSKAELYASELCAHFVYLLDTWVVSTYLLAVVNEAAVNMVVLLAIQISAFTFGYIPRGRIAESYGNSVFKFFEELPYHFPQQLYHFTFPSAMHLFFYLINK